MGLSKRKTNRKTNKKKSSKKIGIIVGIFDDECMNYKLYPELKNIPKDVRELSEKNGKPASDVSIAYLAQKKYKNKNIDILTADDINVSKFKEYDMVIGLFEATNLSITEGYDAFKEYLRVVRKSGVRFYPHPDFIDFAAHKFKWIKHLEKHGLPVLDTIAIRNDKGITYAKDVLKQVEKKGWGEFITKPQVSAYSVGFKKWKPNTTPQQLQKYIRNNYEDNMGDKILVQRYVKEFHEFYEIRTYWINNKYRYAIGTIIEHSNTKSNGRLNILYDLPESEGGNIENHVMKKLKFFGNKALKCIPYDTSLIVRIDFGCCIDNKKNCREYFINEIEYMPNVFCNKTKFPVISEMAKNIIRLSNLKK